MIKRFLTKTLFVTLIAIFFWGGAVLAIRNHWVPGQDVPVLLLHEIGHGEKDRFLSEEYFTWMMDYLKWNKFNIIPMDDYIGILKGKKKMPPKPVVITFDDGERSVYTVAFPALKKRGFTSTVFLVSDFIGKTLYHTVEDRAYNESAPVITGKRIWKFEMLDWDEVREMKKNGFSFQSHSKNHAELISMNSEELKTQLLDSKRKIESEIGSNVEYFSYPWGEFNYVIKETLKDCGYKAAFACEIRDPVLKHDKDSYSMERYEITPFTSRNSFKIIVWGCMPLKFKAKDIVKKFTFIRR